MRPARGPRRDLCVVVVTTSHMSNGLSASLVTTSPEMWAMSLPQKKQQQKKGGAERITHIGSLSKTTTKNKRITASTQGQNAKRPALGDRKRFVRENAHKRGQEATRKAWTNWDRLGQAAEGNLSLPPKKVMIEKHTTAETVLSRPRKIAKKIYTGSSAPA